MGKSSGQSNVLTTCRLGRCRPKQVHLDTLGHHQIISDESFQEGRCGPYHLVCIASHDHLNALDSQSSLSAVVGPHI